MTTDPLVLGLAVVCYVLSRRTRSLPAVLTATADLLAGKEYVL